MEKASKLPIRTARRCSFRRNRLARTTTPARLDQIGHGVQYRSAFGQFSKWCDERSLASMPASMPTVREYIAWLADEGRTVSTINAYLAAIALSP
jgi:hypothetical protein